MKKDISTPNAPAAIGPYSQAIQAGDFLFISGQLPIDPSTGTLDGTDIQTQTQRSIENVISILNAVRLDISAIVKTTVFLSDMNNFSAMNEVYARYFIKPFPARAAVEVARLPKDSLIEIEAIAFLN